MKNMRVMGFICLSVLMISGCLSNYSKERDFNRQYAVGFLESLIEESIWNFDSETIQKILDKSLGLCGIKAIVLIQDGMVLYVKVHEDFLPVVDGISHSDELSFKVKHLDKLVNAGTLVKFSAKIIYKEKDEDLGEIIVFYDR